MKALGRLQTERRTPTPVKTMFAGENTCQMHLMVHITGSCLGRSIPGQRLLRGSQRRSREHLPPGPAISSDGHRYFEIDRGLGLAVEAQGECCWESRSLEAGQRVGAQEGPALCVVHIFSEHYKKFVGSWKTMWQ